MSPRAEAFIQIVSGGTGDPDRPLRVARVKDGRLDTSFDPHLSAPMADPTAAQELAIRWGEIWGMPVMYTVIPEEEVR